MTMISSRSGCKVGWETYDNEAEALARSEEVRETRDSMLSRGYDFGFQWPGQVERLRRYTETLPNGQVNASGPWEWLDKWMVTIP